VRLTHRHAAFATVGLSAVLVLSACGAAATDSTGSTNGMTHGSATSSSAGGAASPARQGDVRFAQMMVPHHQQAVEMADLALQKKASPEVTKLAQQIKAAQDPEIQTMNQWLREWRAPAGSGSHAGHSDGMTSDADMTQLSSATGTEFDRLWLTMMVEHHEGAVDMAEDVLKTTADPEVKRLAQAVVDGQNKEIDAMRGML